jgi:hypothetical protein
MGWILKEATVSIHALSSASVLDSSLATGLITSTNQAKSSSPSVVSTASVPISITSSNTPDLLTQDMINLLRALAYGDVTGAKTELAKFKADLKAQTASLSLNNLAKDVTSLFKDLAAGSSSAAKTDLARVKVDLQTEDSSAAVPAHAISPLENLVAKISDSLSAGSVPSALQDLAGYLVQIGQATGSLINTSA